MKATTHSTKGVVTRWKDIRRWNIRSVLDRDWNWPNEDIKVLGEAIVRRRDRVDRTTFIPGPEHFISIRFTGEVDSRNLGNKTEIKGPLSYAYAGDLVYSKIDVRNGAIGIVPDEFPVAVVTSEFPVYQIRCDVALPEYIQLVLRTDTFKRTINTMISGASGRKRVQPEELEEIEIPLPPLPLQQAVVDYWRRWQEELGKGQRELRTLVSELNDRLIAFFSERSIPLNKILHAPAIVTTWSETELWDTKAARAGEYRQSNDELVPFWDFAEEATELVNPAQQPDHDWPVYGVNNREGVFFSHFQKGRDFNASYKRIKKDWFFHNPTRSAVGSLGIVPDVPEDAITSPEYQVWKLQDGVREILPGFIATLIATPFFIELVKIHRVGAVKQRLYTENLLSISVPPVEIEAQLEIARRRQIALDRIASAEAMRDVAKLEVDSLIKGEKSLEDLRVRTIEPLESKAEFAPTFADAAREGA